MHTAATLRTPGAGAIALAHIERTRPGESRPSSVVRSMQATARSMPASFAAVLIERFANWPARVSSMTASTLGLSGGKRAVEAAVLSVSMAGASVSALKRPAAFLFALDCDEERFEISLSEREAAFALDDLVEKRRAAAHRLREDLQQIPGVITIHQNPEVAQNRRRLCDTADARF